MTTPVTPSGGQASVCPSEEHRWIAVGQTTFCGIESTSLACEICNTPGYTFKEPPRG